MIAIGRFLPAIGLAAMSLVLFAYVGYGEAIRVYTDIRTERLSQLGATLQNSVDQFANAGLPLDQFTGFERRSEQLRMVDPAIIGISLVDVQGEPVFCEAEEHGRERACGRVDLGQGQAEHIRRVTAGVFDRNAPQAPYVDLPVADKFGVVGAVVIHVDRERLEQAVDDAFRPVFAVSIGLFILFALALLVVSARGEVVGQRLLTRMFLGVMTVNVAVMVFVMFNLYRVGTEGQAEALARSMAARLATAAELGIPLSAFSGVGEALEEYRRINPDIAAISLVQRDEVLFSVDDDAAGPTTSRFRRLVFELPVMNESGPDLVLTVQLPLSVVLAALGSGARNFMALFFGCVVFALVFLNAVRGGHTARAGGEDPEALVTARLALLRPAYFLGIFADSLAMPLLPEIAQETVAAAGLPSGWVSLPFTLFFIGLTLALLPASFLTGRIELRRLFAIGATAVGGGLFLAALVPEFWALCLGRAIGGAGQGILLVAVQAYAFEVVGSGQRTRAAAVQVLGYSGGLIVGTGLGGLLAVFNSDHDVLFLGGLVAVATSLYARLVLPPLERREEAPVGRLLDGLGKLLRTPDFMAVLGLVGITSKFALAGVAMFAMPLVLHQSGYGDDEVGQALMVFAIVTYLVTSAAPRFVARIGSIDVVLVLGMTMLAIGIGLLGLLLAPAVDAAAPPTFVPHWIAQAGSALRDWVAASPVPAAAGAAIAVSVAALGVGQGLIAAPVIARVSESRAAAQVGRDRTLAVYRLAERAGHILGPALVGPLLLAAHGHASALVLFGAAFALFAVLYALSVALLRLRPA